VNESLKLARDADGKILPIEGVSPVMGIEVKVLPLTYGASRNYPNFGEPILEWSDEEKAQLLSEQLIEPDLKDETGVLTVEDMMGSYDGWVIEDLVLSVAFYSGLARLHDPDAPGKERAEVSEEA